MGLKQVTLASYTAKALGTEIKVRAISFVEISRIAADFAPDAAMAFSKIVDRARNRHGKNPEITTDEIKDILRSLIPAAPRLVGAVIALASDEYDDEAVDIAQKLPPALQVELLENIFSMTFVSDAELKKLVESITRMLGGVANSVQQMRLPLSDLGIGAFVGESVSS